MALIKCPDCKQEMSDISPACLKCGRPNNATTAEVKATGGALTTTQETAKTFKAQSIAAGALMIVSAITAANTMDSDLDVMNIAVGGVLIGLTWYLVNRLRSWWHHG